METGELRRLRRLQIAATNGMLLMVSVIFLVLTGVFELNISLLNFILGVFILILAVYIFIKRNSTKSFFPLIGKLAIYEKQKLGQEWKKQRMTNTVSLFLIGGLMLFNSYISRGSSDAVSLGDIMIPMLVILFVLVATMNVSLLIHIKKIDGAKEAGDLKGYTWNMNMIGIAIGAIVGVLLFIFLLLYFLVLG